MRWLRVAMARLRALARGEAVEQDIDEEFRFHIEMEAEANIRRGMAPEEARRQAIRSFGNWARVKDAARDVRGGGMLETLWQDLRYGVRMLLKKPGFTAVAVIALALGIGANTAIFSVVNAVLLSALPYEEPDRLVMVWEKRLREGVYDNVVSPADFLDWRERGQSFDSMAAQIISPMDLSGDGEPERIPTGVVSPAFFEVLGVAPMLGRGFDLEEEQIGKHRVAILSHGLWQRRFGSDPGVIDQTVTLSGVPYTVIGVLPDTFRFAGGDLELWRPMAFRDEEKRVRASHFLNVFARLKPGVSIEQAREEMDAIGAQLAQEYPRENENHSAHVVSLREQLVGGIRPALLILMAAVGLVLLIACANVANLLLARAASRQREVAIRSALGAGRLRIVRQFLTESVLLSLVGGAAGVLLALWGVKLLGLMIPDEIPQLKQISPDLRVLIFTLVVSWLTGLLFGLAPALQVSKPALSETLKEGGRGSEGLTRSRLRSLLVVSEIALAAVLMIGAGLMMRSFVKLREVKPGFEAKNVLTVDFALPSSRYREEQKTKAFFKQIVEQTQQLPGVSSAAAVSHLPLSREDSRSGIGIEGREPTPNEPTRAHVRSVTPDYFKTMTIPIIEGRVFTERDLENSPLVAVVSQTTAGRYWPGESPVGRRVRLGGTEVWREVVGVVGDVKHWGLDNKVNPMLYLPGEQMSSASMTLVVRGDADPAAFGAGVRSLVREMDRDLPLGKVRTMEEVTANSVASPRFYTVLFGIFAGLALALAAVGIYGVMSYSVTQRTHEMGIRMALGARSSDVLSLVVRQGMTLGLVGLGVGLAASFLLTGVMKGLLFGVSSTDPLTFAGISVLLTGVALIACYIPARRATKVDPMVALRYE